MAVIALAALIVESDDALAFDQMDQAVFVPMFGWWYRLYKPPDHQLDSRPVIGDIAEARDQLGFHVGNRANTYRQLDTRRRIDVLRVRVAHRSPLVLRAK